MKVNMHYIRKKYEITPRKIKDLLVLEDRLASGRVNKELAQQLGNLYRQFMEYCDYIKEPLKLYFQEKLEYLYLNEKVFKMLIKEDNFEKKRDEIELLSNSFLQFSEIKEEQPGEISEKEYFSNTNYESLDTEQLQKINIKGKHNSRCQEEEKHPVHYDNESK